MPQFVCISNDNDVYKFFHTNEYQPNIFVCEESEYAKADSNRIQVLLKYKNFEFKGISFLKDCQVRLQAHQVIFGNAYEPTESDRLSMDDFSGANNVDSWNQSFNSLTPIAKFRKIRYHQHQFQKWSQHGWINYDIIQELYQTCLINNKVNLGDQILTHRDDLIRLLTGKDPVNLVTRLSTCQNLIYGLIITIFLVWLINCETSFE